MIAATRALPDHGTTTPAKVDATGVRRRIKALGRDGYSTARIDTELGLPPGTARVWLRYSRGIDPRHDAAMADLYARWAGIPAETNGSTVADAEAVRAMAFRRRWPPAAAWDDEIRIDDPQAVPASWRTTWRAEDLFAESEPYLQAGESYVVVAHHLGVKVPALKRARERIRARERAAAPAAPPPST